MIAAMQVVVVIRVAETVASSYIRSRWWPVTFRCIVYYCLTSTYSGLTGSAEVTFFLPMSVQNDRVAECCTWPGLIEGPAAGPPCPAYGPIRSRAKPVTVPYPHSVSVNNTGPAAHIFVLSAQPRKRVA